MSIELSKDNLDYQEILKTPLLQSGELSKASEIIDPEKIDREDLLILWRVARDYSNLREFIAVAFTQFNPEMFSKLGVRNGLTRIIYFTDDDELKVGLRDRLIINPHFLNTSKEKQVNLEGCGSIEHDNIAEVVARSAQVEISCFLWDPWSKRPMFEKIKMSGLTAFFHEHEYVHLQGEDSSFEGNGLLDFSDVNTPGWKGMERRQNEIWNDLHGPLGRHLKWKELLVPRNDKLIIVDFNGHYIRDFMRTTS